MVQTAGTYGYTGTTVQQLVKVAKVSTKALYERFENKEGCLLETFDMVVLEAAARIAAASRAGGRPASWAESMERALDAFAGEVSARPQAARLALVEVLAAGPRGLERAGRTQMVLERALGDSVTGASDSFALAPALLHGVAGGLWWTAHLHVLEGRPQRVAELKEELLQWLLCYRIAGAARLEDTVPHVPAPRPLPAGSAAADERTRMLLAAAKIAAARGYAKLTTGQIALEAGVDQEQLIELFGGVEECFLAAVELLTAQAAAGALREAQSAPDWASGVQRGLSAMLAQIAASPILARSVFVELLAAGPAGLWRRARLTHGFAQLLARSAPATQRPSQALAEAVVGATWGLVHRHVQRGAARRLPGMAHHAAYLALAPCMGAEAAVQAIVSTNGG